MNCQEKLDAKNVAHPTRLKRDKTPLITGRSICDYLSITIYALINS